MTVYIYDTDLVKLNQFQFFTLRCSLGTNKNHLSYTVCNNNLISKEHHTHRGSGTISRIKIYLLHVWSQTLSVILWRNILSNTYLFINSTAHEINSDNYSHYYYIIPSWHSKKLKVIPFILISVECMKWGWYGSVLRLYALLDQWFCPFVTPESPQKLTENHCCNILLMLITWLILPAGWFEGQYFMIFSAWYLLFKWFLLHSVVVQCCFDSILCKHWWWNTTKQF